MAQCHMELGAEPLGWDMHQGGVQMLMCLLHTTLCQLSESTKECSSEELGRSSCGASALTVAQNNMSAAVTLWPWPYPTEEFLLPFGKLSLPKAVRLLSQGS
jgi:hypothetical protein